MIENTQLYPIGVIERDTGIGRDTLRVWERRYGFPDPVCNAKGERVYPEIQLRRLQRIRRLLDRGIRPGKLLPLSEEALDGLEARLQPAAPERLDETVREILNAIRSADAWQVESLLRRQYQQQGMQAFITGTVVPLLRRVGELWIGGKLQVFQEHFLSEQLIRFLNTEISTMQKSAGKPLVVLATLPGEEHTLGLLMLTAMLSSRGISVINLGGEVPMDQIGRAVQQFQADVVGITFSGAYQYRNIRQHLLELRELLADMDIDIRADGQADPEAINRVIESAVMTWHLPDRVKRLSLPVYRYDNVDLVHLDIVLAVDSRLKFIGIAVWEQADTRESPAGSKELSLHGIYVALHIIGKKSAVNFSGLLKKPSANTDLMDCWPRHNRVQMVWTHLLTQWLPEPSRRTSP